MTTLLEQDLFYRLVSLISKEEKKEGNLMLLISGLYDSPFHNRNVCYQFIINLALYDVYSDIWNWSLSSKTLKRVVTLWCIENDKKSGYCFFRYTESCLLKYSDYVAVKYPEVNLGSLVEASIDLAMTSDQSANASYEYLVGNATDFLMGICNVQILNLSANTLEVIFE